MLTIEQRQVSSVLRRTRQDLRASGLSFLTGTRPVEEKALGSEEVWRVGSDYLLRNQEELSLRNVVAEGRGE